MHLTADDERRRDALASSATSGIPAPHRARVRLRRACKYAELHGKRAGTGSVIRAPNVLGVSCTAGPASRSRSGAAVAAHDVRRTEWRTATAVTPSRWRRGRQLGCRAEAGPCQLHTKVRPRKIIDDPHSTSISRMIQLVL